MSLSINSYNYGSVDRNSAQYKAAKKMVESGKALDGGFKTKEQQIINISDDIRKEMFDTVKSEFINENGVLNGDTTKRSDVYTDCYKGVAKADRLKAGYTLEQYERAYRQACIEAVKAGNPNWKIGQPFDASILNSVTRESVESQLAKSGNTLVKKTSSGSTLDIKI